MTELDPFEIWFVTGSQHLYGEETLEKVAEHAQAIAKALSGFDQIPVKVVFKPRASPDTQRPWRFGSPTSES